MAALEKRSPGAETGATRNSLVGRFRAFHNPNFVCSQSVPELIALHLGECFCNNWKRESGHD